MSGYNIIGFPRCGTTYLYDSLVSAYKPSAMADEPFHMYGRDTTSDLKYNIESEKILDNLLQAKLQVSKHHINQCNTIQKLYPNRTHRLLTENVNIFVWRKNMFKRAVSHYFMENRIPPRRKTGTMHVVDAQRIKNLIVDYPLWVQLAKFKKIDFKYKLVYEDLPTNPNDLTKFIGLPEHPFIDVPLKKQYDAPPIHSYVKNYGELWTAAHEARKILVDKGFNISEKLILDIDV